MKKEAFAKINLTLDITGTLPDGYHSLFTVMTQVKCADIIGVTLRDDCEIVLSADKDYIPLDEKNTCYKAAALFYRLSGIKGGCDITIENRVPSGAGLGNSSSDAAVVLRTLNELYGYPVEDDELCRQSVKVGADVPFCYALGTKLCLNTGEEMYDLPAFDYPVLIVKIPESFPTAGAYARYDAADSIVHPDNEKFLEYARLGDYKSALGYAGNVFEQVQPREPIEKIKAQLISDGAFYSAMSGSGSAVFGVFQKDTSPEKFADLVSGFEKAGCFAFASY